MKLLVAALALFASSAFAAECRLPLVPPLPDGETASEAEILAAREQIAQYVAAGEAFIVCLTVTRDGSDPNTPPEKLAEWTKQHNAAVDQMQAIATAFNRELARYKARAESSSESAQGRE